MWPRFISWGQWYMWVEFVVGSLLCSERFFSGYSNFPLSSKTNIFKFQFDQESGRQRTTLWMCYLQIIIYLFIYLYSGLSALLDNQGESRFWTVYIHTYIHTYIQTYISTLILLLLNKGFSAPIIQVKKGKKS